MTPNSESSKTEIDSIKHDKQNMQKTGDESLEYLKVEQQQEEGHGKLSSFWNYLVDDDETQSLILTLFFSLLIKDDQLLHRVTLRN